MSAEPGDQTCASPVWFGRIRRLSGKCRVAPAEPIRRLVCRRACRKSLGGAVRLLQPGPDSQTAGHRMENVSITARARNACTCACACTSNLCIFSCLCLQRVIILRGCTLGGRKLPTRDGALTKVNSANIVTVSPLPFNPRMGPTLASVARAPGLVVAVTATAMQMQQPRKMRTGRGLWTD